MQWHYRILILTFVFLNLDLCQTNSLPETTENQNESKEVVIDLRVSPLSRPELDDNSSTKLIFTKKELSVSSSTPKSVNILYFLPTTDGDVDEDVEYKHDEHPEGDDFYVGAAARISMPFYSVPRHLTCYYCNYGNNTETPKCLNLHDTYLNRTGCLGNETSCYTSVNIVGNRIANVERGCRLNCTSTTTTFCCQIDRCNNERIAVFPKPLMSSILKMNNTSHTEADYFVLIVLFILQHKI